MTALTGEEPQGVALVYEATEEAKLLMLAGDDDALVQARIAAGEAAYYLSDTIGPDERESLLALAEQHRRAGHDKDHAPTAEALTLLTGAASEVEVIMRGPGACSELLIALGALRRAIGSLARHLGIAADDIDGDSPPDDRAGVLRRMHRRPH
jgi:hypothetical protein